MKIAVAIDGPSGAGKSTVARAVAERLGYLYVDSGAMYRAVGLAALERGLDPHRAQKGGARARPLENSLEKAPAGAPDAGARVRVDGRDVTEAIRQPRVAQAASVVATIPAVRELLGAQQQRIGAGGGIVMEGRRIGAAAGMWMKGADIGAVVFPRAELKIFVSAAVDERARRRYEQQREQG